MSSEEVFRMDRAKGSSIGATIVGGFGGVWLAMGMTAAGVPLRVALAIVVPVFVLIACLGSTVRRRLPQIAAAATPEKKQRMRAFGLVNVAEWIAIFGTVNLLHNLQLNGWITPAVVLIVGAHFLPLAQLFGARAHVVTGVAMMLWAALALVVPASVRDVVECVGAGLILWASGAAALYAAFRMTAMRDGNSPTLPAVG
ncbi:MAG TPA: hypothetical protein VGM02_09640 [Acidobacteriaceae bacterium]